MWSQLDEILVGDLGDLGDQERQAVLRVIEGGR
jgi:hypothetical protein